MVRSLRPAPTFPDSEVQLTPGPGEDIAGPFRRNEEAAKARNREDRPTTKPKKEVVTNSDLQEMSDRLRKALATKVSIRHGKKGGKIEIDFYSSEELTRIADKIEGN